MAKKRRVRPGGTWAIVSREYRPGMWGAIVFTIVGEPVASAMHVRCERAEKAALDEALEMARPERVLREDELGEEHEELRDRFVEQIARWREIDREMQDPELEYVEALADFLEVASEHPASIVVTHDDDVITLDFAPAEAMTKEAVAALRKTGWQRPLLPVLQVTGRAGTIPVSLVHLRVVTAALRRRAA